jgi:hypothetical protein
VNFHFKNKNYLYRNKKRKAMAKLEEGQEVTINIPFTYTIGDEGPVTGKILETVEDCENEVREEIDAGLNGCDLLLNVES